MISGSYFIKQSLGLNLFFARIMKEHALFLAAAFTCKDINFINQAEGYRLQFDSLLADAVSLSDGMVNPAALQSGEVITPYTMNAENTTAFFTGVNIQTSITQAESDLSGNDAPVDNPALEQRVALLNQRAMNLVESLIQFKSNVLNMVLSCRLFTNNYPLAIDHMMREAKLYLMLLRRLQSREEADPQKFAYEQEAFWNRIMAEHAKFTRGMLDPTENDLFNTANRFGNEFDSLTAESVEASDSAQPLSQITDKSLKATREIRDFDAQSTQGLLQCKIRSVILPLLTDHNMREASHYMHLLEIFKTYP